MGGAVAKIAPLIKKVKIKMNYFAYGSNMDRSQMKERCPNARFLTVAILENFALDFTIYSPKRMCGCADVVPKNGYDVYGLIYEINEFDLERLDGFENVPTAYTRVERSLKNLTGESTKAFVYEVTEKKPFVRPSREYLDLLKNAAKNHGFPESYQRMLRAIPTIIC